MRKAYLNWLSKHGEFIGTRWFTLTHIPENIYLWVHFHITHRQNLKAYEEQQQRMQKYFEDNF